MTIAAASSPAGTPVEWSVLIPFFNERELLPATIAGIAAQTVPAKLILIDNGSTDGSAAVAVAEARARGLDFVCLGEPFPGKVAALSTGLAHATTRWTATCDADTLYPPHYLESAATLLRQPGVVVAGAYFVAPGSDAATRDARARTIVLAARLLPRQCHTGGAGQSFCTAALKAAGGFDTGIWNYVLEDHEVIHRMMRRGAMRYAPELWCMPSPRERDRASIRWTLGERLLYSAAAPFAGDWFFYRFLAGRLGRRRLLSDSIRESPHQHAERNALAPSDPVR